MVKLYKQQSNGDIDVIDLTPEQAITHQGGTSADPWKNLLAGGWSLAKPAETNFAPTPNTIPQSIVEAPNTDSFIPFSETTEGQEYLKKINDLYNQVGVLTPDEEAEIERQAQQAGDKYNILIKEAQEKKKQGLATATVAAGQRGGFETTQFAGAAALPPTVAALPPTVGGTFVGQGGALEKIASAYDLNIENLEIQKQQAINEARNALREAKLTGKTEKLNKAQKLYELAVKNHNDALDFAYKKVQTLKATQDYFKSQVQFTADRVANSIIGYLTGEPATDNALIAESAAAYGLSSGDLLSSLRRIQDEQSFYKSSDLLAIAKTIPAGKTKTIIDLNTGRKYTIEGLADRETITVTSDNGTVVTLDKKTLKEVARSAPGIGKTKTQPSNITINAVGNRTPFYINGKQGGWQTYNSQTGKVMVFDMNGNQLPQLPEGAQLGTFSAGNPSEEEQLIQDLKVLLTQ